MILEERLERLDRWARGALSADRVERRAMERWQLLAPDRIRLLRKERGRKLLERLALSVEPFLLPIDRKKRARTFPDSLTHSGIVRESQGGKAR